MAIVNLSINGRQVQAQSGQSILDAAQAAGIWIPALCHHPALRPEGACRVCLVEIEKQRAPQPACTFPVAEGLVVHTESDKVIAARKFALEMLFSERTHYCMYCAASGGEKTTECELQRIAYRYGMDCWAYPPNYAKRWPVDATRAYFVMDHGRCILCRRCVRACSDIAANHTLGVQQRGTRTMICANDDVPFGKSTCVSCGTCLQVCPTGALTDRRAAYLGHRDDLKRTKATCLACPVGCGIEAVTQRNRLLWVEGDWSAANGGLLCADGRFKTAAPIQPRVLAPLVRRDGQLREAGWDEALGLVAKRLRSAKRAAGLISPRTVTETLVAFSYFFNEVLNSDEVALLYGEIPPLELGEGAMLADVAAADCVIVVGGDPLAEQKVVGYFVRRAFDRDAKLLVIHDTPTGLDELAHVRLRLDGISHAGMSPFQALKLTYHLRLDGISKLKKAVEAAQRPVVLYGGELSTAVYAALRALPAKVKFLPLLKGANAAAAARLGLHTGGVSGDVLYVLAGDDERQDAQLPPAEFTVVQAAYLDGWTDTADVVLPARTWAEKQGHIVNIEGRRLPVTALLEAPRNVHADHVTLGMLSATMGHPLMYGAIADIPGSL